MKTRIKVKEKFVYLSADDTYDREIEATPEEVARWKRVEKSFQATQKEIRLKLR